MTDIQDVFNKSRKKMTHFLRFKASVVLPTFPFCIYLLGIYLFCCCLLCGCGKDKSELVTDTRVRTEKYDSILLSDSGQTFSKETFSFYMGKNTLIVQLSPFDSEGTSAGESSEEISTGESSEGASTGESSEEISTGESSEGASTGESPEGASAGGDSMAISADDSSYNSSIENVGMDEVTLCAYIDAAAHSGNQVKDIYLFLNPVITTPTKEGLLRSIQSNPAISFHILLSCPSLSYWLSLDVETVDEELEAYENYPTYFSDCANVTLYYPGYEEWLVANPGNFLEDGIRTNPVITEKLLLFTFCDGNYAVTPDVAETSAPSASATDSSALTTAPSSSAIDSSALTTDSSASATDSSVSAATSGSITASVAVLKRLIARERITPTQYPDFSGYRFVFFGDSIIDIVQGSHSIPGVIQGLTGATCESYAHCGSTATFRSKENQDLPNVLEAFLAENNTYHESVIFLLNFGLNDYFTGCPVSGNNEDSYGGSLTISINKLQQAYPDAMIIILGPTYTDYYQAGTEINSPQGGVLADYIAMAEIVAEETGSNFFNQYSQLGIDRTNLYTYSDDGCHPNEFGRLYMGRNLIEYISGLVSRR